MAKTQPAGEALTARVRPVNVTVDEVVPGTQPADADGGNPCGPAPPSPMRIPPASDFARAGDGGARLVHPVRRTAERVTAPSPGLGRRPVPAGRR